MRRRGWAIAALAVGLGMAFPTLAAAPPGWIIAGNAPADYEFAVDKTTAASGKASASITAKRGARANGFGMLIQAIAADDYRGSRLRLSGYLRTQAANRAQMMMRVDGPDGRVLGFDNMDSRPVTDTTGWTRYDIVLDVPRDSVDIIFGFLLISSGKVWADDFKLETVDRAVPVTSAGPPSLPRVPANLDFEDTDTTQTAVWTARKLRIIFVVPAYPCDLLYDDVKRLLLQLGARASDLELSEYQCFGDRSGIDVSFSVLAPTNTTRTNTAGELLGRWQTIDIKLDTVPRDEILTGSRVDRRTQLVRQQLLVWMLKQKILPLIPTRSVQFDGDNSLRAEILEPGQQ